MFVVVVVVCVGACVCVCVHVLVMYVCSMYRYLYLVMYMFRHTWKMHKHINKSIPNSGNVWREKFVKFILFEHLADQPKY